MAASEPDRSFPVPLVCPGCGAGLRLDAACSCAAGTRLETWNGIPRLLFGQSYRGEYPREIMAEVLRRMDSTPWRRVLDEVAPYDHVLRRLTDFIGPEFVCGMPWSEIRTVLDVDSGMGSMTALLAERAELVVALEATPERAEFQRKRAVQDGFSNWRPVIAGANFLPFPPETFDLITLNGGFERLGLTGEGDPVELQRRFLTNALRLLKPNGYLYIGAGNRLALSTLLGIERRSGLRRERAPRIRKHTPKEYARMLSQAGFGSVELYGAFEGYDRQKAVYLLSDVGPRRITREFLDPPASWKGRLIRWIENAGPVCAAIENNIVVFGRKSSKPGPLVWPGLPRDGAVTQFSSSDKVFALCFEDAPVKVFKGPKTDVAALSLAKEHAFIQDASRRHGAAVDSWPLRWPKPLGTLDLSGRKFYAYEFAHGRSLAVELLPVSFELPRFARLISRLIERYVELCDRMTAAAPPTRERAWADLSDRLAAVPIPDAAASAAIKAACDRLREKGWIVSLTHGDLSLNNTVLLPDESMVLVDWENVSPEGGLVALDLTRLLYDVWDESSLLDPAERRAVMEATKGSIREALSRRGVVPEEYPEIEALFVAHQFRLWLAREPGSASSDKARALLQRYRDRESSLSF